MLKSKFEIQIAVNALHIDGMGAFDAISVTLLSANIVEDTTFAAYS